MDSGRTDSGEGGSANGQSVVGLSSAASSIGGGGGGSTPTVDSVAAGTVSVDATGGYPVATETVAAAMMAGEDSPPRSRRLVGHNHRGDGVTRRLVRMLDHSRGVP